MQIRSRSTPRSHYLWPGVCSVRVPDSRPATSRRDWSPSFRSTASTCLRTVCIEILSSRAISLLVRRVASRSAIRPSAGVRPRVPLSLSLSLSLSLCERGGLLQDCCLCLRLRKPSAGSLTRIHGLVNHGLSHVSWSILGASQNRMGSMRPSLSSAPRTFYWSDVLGWHESPRRAAATWAGVYHTTTVRF
jgi:hypothetical protein